jgi:ABC-2 type transport system permease protein
MTALSTRAPSEGRAHQRRAFAALLRTESKLFVREPMMIFWGVLFPVVLLIIIGSASGDKHQKALGGLRFIVVYTPTVMVFTLAILALNALPAALAAYREKGYLRRLSTTPVGAFRLLGAQFAIIFCISALTVILLAVVARIAFNVPLPQSVGGFILAIVLGVAAMLGLGTLIASLVPTPRTASIVGSLLFFPMMFFAGLWVPRAEMGSVLRHVSDFMPLGALVAAVQNTEAGHWAGTSHLLVLLGWAVIMCLAAGRLFRWES